MTFAHPTWWPQETAACYDDLVSYQLVGASVCADRIAVAMVRLAEEAEKQGRDLGASLDEAARAFCALKPDTALYVNVIALVAHASRQDRAADILERALSLSAYRQQAQQRVLEHAALALDGAELLLVHDYSSTVISLLAELASQRPRRVIVTAGEPLGQGEKVANLVASMGHHVLYTPDMSVSRIVKGADAFITGVESFYSDGSLANTVGTVMLALLCREHGIPVIAPTECLKYDLQRDTIEADDLTARLLNPWPRGERSSSTEQWYIEDHVLDAVPGALVSSYVTEAGTSSSGDVARAALAVWAGLNGGFAQPIPASTSTTSPSKEMRSA